MQARKKLKGQENTVVASACVVVSLFVDKGLLIYTSRFLLCNAYSSANVCCCGGHPSTDFSSHEETCDIAPCMAFEAYYH